MRDDIRISDYSYPLPPERIAAFPLAERDQSRLLVYKAGDISHKTFKDVGDELPTDATLYFNNSKVIQARLHFEKETGAVIEVFLLHPVSPSTLLLHAMQSTRSCAWQCTIGNLKRWKEGTVLKKKVGNLSLSARLIGRSETLIEFTWNSETTFAEVLDVAGETPLPPYLRREAIASDKERYQTVYSNVEGAVAAPTAGLHFTPNLLEELKGRGIREEFLTLHVSAGTFLPVKTEVASQHVMHQEQVIITRKNVESLLNDAFTIAIGTTAMRTMESLYWYGVKLANDEETPFHVTQHDPYTLREDISRAQSLRNVLERMDSLNQDEITGETSIYIMPGYDFKICQALITNFHQPGSTLILLVAAFVGHDWRKIYEEALKNGYRFLSYGDSSLLIPKP